MLCMDKWSVCCGGVKMLHRNQKDVSRWIRKSEITWPSFYRVESPGGFNELMTLTPTSTGCQDCQVSPWEGCSLGEKKWPTVFFLQHLQTQLSRIYLPLGPVKIQHFLQEVHTEKNTLLLFQNNKIKIYTTQKDFRWSNNHWPVTSSVLP